MTAGDQSLVLVSVSLSPAVVCADFICTVVKSLGLDGRLNSVSIPSYNWVKFLFSKTRVFYIVEILVGQHEFKFKHTHWDSSLLGHSLVSRSNFTGLLSCSVHTPRTPAFGRLRQE